MRKVGWCTYEGGCRSLAAGLLAGVVAAAELPGHATAQSLDCSCEAQLEALIGATRTNYAGFRDKASTPTDSVVHARFVELLRRRALRTPGAGCLPVLRDYIGFFQDGHLQVRSSAAGAAAPVGRATSDADADEAERVSDGAGARIAGLWESSSGRTRLQIIQAAAPYSQRDYHAVVRVSADTSWSPGDVYATFVFDPDRGVYHATWFARGRQPQEWAAVIVDDTLLLTGFSGWHRMNSDLPGDPRSRRDPLRPSFRSIMPLTAVLTLPSMQVQYGAAVDSLIRAHAREISGLDVLIVDVRGNQGGGDATYMPLLPLLYADTIVTGAGSVLSSAGTIAFYERFLDPAGVDSPAWVVDMLAQMRARPGTQIALPSSQLTYDRVQARPGHVAILTDAVGASSTETFLLKAVQSSKVRLFGQATAGIVDYLNPAQHQLGCGLTLQAPTIRRSIRLPADAIDTRGIQPNVALPWTEPDPIRQILAVYGAVPLRRE